MDTKDVKHLLEELAILCFGKTRFVMDKAVIPKEISTASTASISSSLSGW